MHTVGKRGVAWQAAVLIALLLLGMLIIAASISMNYEGEEPSGCNQCNEEETAEPNIQTTSIDAIEVENKPSFSG